MENLKISDEILYIGAEDKDLDLFESQYRVPDGISYNSYVIMDEKIAIMDTIDRRKTHEWVYNLERVLNGKEPDYLIVSHLEPDHSYNIDLIMKKYPDLKIVGNTTTFKILPQFFSIENLQEREIVVKEGDTLNLGKHSLQFFMAPMVHWPEVMLIYEKSEKILFSADGFGRFGSIDNNDDWVCEGRRYYFNIIGKYGMQVQATLKKLEALDVNMICPLHGPILKENLDYYINKYNVWSSYEAEDKGVLIAYASIHGNTADCAKEIEKLLKEKGEENVSIFDLSRCDVSEAIEDAFRYDRIILAASSYNMGVFTPMNVFLTKLKGLNFQNRKIALIENGSWAPSAGKCIKEQLSEMKNIELLEPMITIYSRMNDKNMQEIKDLVEEILK